MCGVTEGERRLVGTVVAAAHAGVDRSTLSRWQTEGRVKPTKWTAGGHARWDLDDLDRQLVALREARTRETGPATDG